MANSSYQRARVNRLLIDVVRDMAVHVRWIARHTYHEIVDPDVQQAFIIRTSYLIDRLDAMLRIVSRGDLREVPETERPNAINLERARLFLTSQQDWSRILAELTRRSTEGRGDESGDETRSRQIPLRLEAHSCEVTAGRPIQLARQAASKIRKAGLVSRIEPWVYLRSGDTRVVIICGNQRDAAKLAGVLESVGATRKT